MRLVTPITEIDPQVSFPDHLEWDQRSSGSLFLSPSAEDPNYIGGEAERTEASRGMLGCDDVLAFIHDVPVAKRARRGTLLGGAQDDTEKFGPLKVVLGAIPALYANHEVRLKPHARNFHFTKTLPGNRYCEQ